MYYCQMCSLSLSLHALILDHYANARCSIAKTLAISRTYCGQKEPTVGQFLSLMLHELRKLIARYGFFQVKFNMEFANQAMNFP